MALPKIDVPTFELTLPISKKKVTFRPFLVKEQKILLMAMESNDASVIQNAVIDILDACIVTPNFPIYDMPVVDVEYLFLNLRAKSVSEIVESKYRCNNEVTKEDGTTKECGTIMEAKIDLTEIKPVNPASARIVELPNGEWELAIGNYMTTEYSNEIELHNNVYRVKTYLSGYESMPGEVDSDASIDDEYLKVYIHEPSFGGGASDKEVDDAYDMWDEDIAQFKSILNKYGVKYEYDGGEVFEIPTNYINNWSKLKFPA